MVTRAVTQLYDDVLRPSGLRVTQFSILATLAGLGQANLRQLADTLAIEQTTLTRSLGLLERGGLIERMPHPDARVKALRLTSGGRRTLERATPLWRQAQDRVLREWGTTAWADAERRLAHLLSVALRRRHPRRGRRPAPASVSLGWDVSRTRSASRVGRITGERARPRSGRDSRRPPVE